MRAWRQLPRTPAAVRRPTRPKPASDLDVALRMGHTWPTRTRIRRLEEFQRDVMELLKKAASQHQVRLMS